MKTARRTEIRTQLKALIVRAALEGVIPSHVARALLMLLRLERA
jgi:hypothetical protein